MALSGSFTTTGGYEGREYKFSWSADQSVASNTSTISWTLEAVGGSSSWYVERTVKVVLAGETVYSKTAAVNRYTGKVASGTKTISHNSDGSKSFSASVEAASYYGAINSTGSKSFTLNTIARATTPTLSASSVDMGAKVTISTPRASSSFTHDLAYSFAGESYVSIATGVATSHTWTVPDLASKIPNATSGTVTIRCITKNGSTTIGTKTVLLTAKVPASVVPSISAVTLAEATAGLAAQFKAYIQNKSKVKATITAAGAKGSTIKSYSTTFQGKTYTGASWTSGLLANSGTLTMTTKVTDSRGRTASKKTSLSVLAYTLPAIAAFSAYRCTQDGKEANDGTYVSAHYEYTVPALNGGNTAAMVIERKIYGTTEWEAVHRGASTAAYATIILPGFSIDNQWDLRLSVTDWFGGTTYYPILLPTAEVIMDILADGTGVGFGKVAELSNLLDIDWAIRTLGGQIPIVLEQGTDLDDLLTPNVYAGKNANAGEYANCPIESATFTLEVLPAGEGSQLMQRFTSCSKNTPQVFERWYYGGSWGAWLCVFDFPGKVLWSGGMYMTEGHTIPLEETVDKQPTGIVLVFSEYVDGEAKNQTFNTHFIPKKQVANHLGTGHSFMMATSNLVYFATKYLYIKNDSISGHANNSATGTASSGITYANNRFVLRYVIGV